MADKLISPVFSTCTPIKQMRKVTGPTGPPAAAEQVRQVYTCSSKVVSKYRVPKLEKSQIFRLSTKVLVCVVISFSVTALCAYY